MRYDLLSINGWWQSLTAFDKIFWAIALVFSLLFLLQTILSFVAGDGDSAVGDADLATESDEGIGYGFLTVKNFVAFFTIFGWTGVALSAGNVSKTLTIGISLLAGCTVVVIMFLLMRSMSRLKESGTLLIKNAVGKSGTVYLLIPASRKGTGKVTINLQGSQRELNAVTDDPVDIRTGSFITVTGILDDHVLTVTAL